MKLAISSDSAQRHPFSKGREPAELLALRACTYFGDQPDWARFQVEWQTSSTSAGVHRTCTTQFDQMKTFDLPVGSSWQDNPLLVGGSRRVTFMPQQTIYRAGAIGETVYLVGSGFIKSVIWSADGAERIVQVARRGDAVGLSALVHRPHGRTAIAMSEVEATCVPVHLAIDAERSNSQFAEQILAHYQASIETADFLLTELNTGGAAARVARLLLFLMKDDTGNECFLPKRDDMAALLGTTVETNSRIVSTFRRAGLIELVRPDRCRCNLIGLTRIAGQ